MKEREKKKQIAKISIFITSIFVIFISFAYAFINQTLTGTKRQVITAGNLELELREGNAITIENAMPMYDEVGMIQDSYDFTLTNKVAENIEYVLKLKDVTEESAQKLDPLIVRYGFTKNEEVMKDYLSNLTDNILDEGTIQGHETIEYSLRFWIEEYVEDESWIKDQTISYKIEVEAKQKIAVVQPKTAGEIIGKNLWNNCKKYDDGTDTFLVGKCDQNYVWYSGKLWRVVLKNNETGAVKMVTDNAITTISYNPEKQSAFENSYVDQWLSQEFLPTLHNYQDYLMVDSIWDATPDKSNTPSRPKGTVTVQRTVGLLNHYEYYTTYNNSEGIAVFYTGYLNNNTEWWLINPYDTSFSYGVLQNGHFYLKNSSNSLGVRPSVNLKSNIAIASGDGTIDKPYLLEGDSKETINGTTLLSTRYSGEYIMFNNELYRIIGVEEGKTKIIAVDIPDIFSMNSFHGDDTITNFASSSIKGDLETYYQNNIAAPYKSMIDENQLWYLGAIGSGINYKASICKTVNQDVSAGVCERTDAIALASIGLPRVGEMFTSQITRGTKTVFWTLTPYSASSWVFAITRENGGGGDSPTSEKGARPSMYLKSNVVIASTNTGDGTYEHPYDIELGT